MTEQMSATVRMETGMRFDAEAGSGHHVTLDAAEHSGGHNAGFRPMELLLVGLAGKVAHVTHTFRIIDATETQAITIADTRAITAAVP